jgi:hypothetical protein
MGGLPVYLALSHACPLQSVMLLEGWHIETGTYTFFRFGFSYEVRREYVAR